MGPETPAEDDWALIDRIIQLRSQGWTFEQIGAQLKAEGFNPQNPAAWPAQILRRLVQQRDAD
jgi:DNA-binding transcriptional MerR regulator